MEDDTTTRLVEGWSWTMPNWSWFIIVKFLAAIIGFFGNLLVILVLFQRRSPRRSTDTLVLALAIADALTSAFIVPIPVAISVPGTWIGVVYCKVIYSTIFWQICVTGSIYTLVGISVERFCAVAYPLYFRRKFTRRRVTVTIVVMWMIIIGMFIPAAVITYGLDRRSGRCFRRFASVTAVTIFGVYVFMLRILIPILIMLLTQVLIACKLQAKATSLPQNAITSGNSAGQTFHIVARDRVLKLMLVVIVFFIIFYSPSQIGFL